MGKFKIVSRKDWGALTKPKGIPLAEPARIVYYVNSFTMECLTNLECEKTMQLLQLQQTKRKRFPDICYNFLVGGNDCVYEGRGGLVQPNLPKEYAENNHQSMLIALVGLYKDEYEIPDKVLRNANLLIDYALERKFLRWDYEVVEHYELVDLPSMGDPEDATDSDI